MIQDYPAAHSMDTQWFAIDQMGQIGFFWSGEAGAVPLDAVQDAEADQILTFLQSVQPTPMIYDPSGHLLTNTQGSFRDHLYGASHGYAVLMYLDSLDAIQRQLNAGEVQTVPTTSGFGVVWRVISNELFQELHDQSICQGCYFAPGAFSDGVLHSQQGVYVYNHLTENWVSGPYGRQEIPVNPLHVDQLPPNLRKSLKRSSLNMLQFSQTQRIQPFELKECGTWESGWMNAACTHIRPVPDHSEEFEERYGEMVADSGYIIEFENSEDSE